MTDFFLQIGLSNACFSLALAIVAMAVGAKARRPHLAHLLWLLVFIKLLTPPIVSIPIVTIPQRHESTPALTVPGNRQYDIDGQSKVSASARIGSLALRHGKEWFPPVWLLGSVVVFAWSMVRVCRFMRLLAAESEVAPAEVHAAAVQIAGRLGLKRIPAIHTTSARLSPLVWWVGGNVRIVIPTAVLEKMDAKQSQWILAHELAHVRRRDYLVRWLEWLACVCFWWNPVVWWAQRNLRATEEICCDDLVISCLNPKPKIYANSLFSAVEFFARPVLRAPAVASELNRGGFLERRFKMIVSEKTNRSNCRWLQICVLLCAMVVLPLRIASAADHEAVGNRLRAAIAAGELTADEARIMLGALRRTAQSDERQSSTRGDERSRYEGFARRIRAAVAEGKMTREEGREQLAGFRRRMAMAERGERAERGDGRREYEGFERRIKAAVAEGKMTREEAAEQLAGFRRRMEMAERGERERGERSITVEEYKRAEAKMRKMVEDGEAKPEDVERRLIEMRKMIGERGERSERGERRLSREDYARAAAELKKAVAEGRITEEQAKARLEGMRRMIGGQADRERDIDWEAIKARIEGAVKSGKMTREEADAQYEAIKRRMAGKTDSDSKRISREDFAKAAREIRKAIAEGKITEEQGRAKLGAMRKMIGEKSEGDARKRSREDAAGKGVDWEGIKKRIESAVKSGKMTREEADAKYKAIRERMAGPREW